MDAGEWKPGVQGPGLQGAEDAASGAVVVRGPAGPWSFEAAAPR